MEFVWTDFASVPERLYRVCRPGQRTVWNNTGFVAPNQSFFWAETNMSQFISSLVNHRRGVKEDSPYISFFEDLNEAEAWCVAAEQVFEEKAYIAVLHLRNEVMQMALAMGQVRGGRLTDIVDILEYKKPELINHCPELEVIVRGLNFKQPYLMPVNNMANSEWVFIHKVPDLEITMYEFDSSEIRYKILHPAPPRIIISRCQCGEVVDIFQAHHCWWNSVILECECRLDNAEDCPNLPAKRPVEPVTNTEEPASNMEKSVSNTEERDYFMILGREDTRLVGPKSPH